MYIVTDQHKQSTSSMEPQTSLISVASLNADFTRLLMSVRGILSSSPNQQDNLEKCKDYCLLNFKVSDSSSESLFSPEKTTKIRECSNFKQLFEIISEHTSWDEHSMLTHIAIQCESVEGQQEIEKFDKKLALFEGLQLISSTSKQNMPKDFVKFCVIIKKSYRNITIKEYKKVKSYIFSNLETNSSVSVGFITLLYHSLHIEWLVTVQAVPHMIKNAHQSKDIFIKENYVFMQIGSEVVIEDKVCKYIRIRLYNSTCNKIKAIYYTNTIFLNQARTSRRLAHAPGFLKLILCGSSVCVCVFVCVSAPEAINNYWHDMNSIRLVKQVL